jgi:hypothetical protein
MSLKTVSIEASSKNDDFREGKRNVANEATGKCSKIADHGFSTPT